MRSSSPIVESRRERKDVEKSEAKLQTVNRCKMAASTKPVKDLEKEKLALDLDIIVGLSSLALI